jgi:hypothetical protein
MNSIHDVLPLAEIQGKFESTLKVEQLGLAEFGKIKQVHADDLSALILNVWNRIVHSGRRVNRWALSDYIVPDPVNVVRVKLKAIDVIEGIVKAKLIRDISCIKCTIEIPGDKTQTVAELVVALVFPNDLHIADVKLQDPLLPIAEENRNYPKQEFAGLGLLATTMARAERYAAHIRADFVTLTAAHDYLEPKFAALGYQLEANEMAQNARCMEKRVLAQPVPLTTLPVPTPSDFPVIR